MRRGGLADRRFHQSHFRGRSTARNLRAVDNGEYVDKMWIGEDEGSRTPGDTVERLLHLARELIALRCDVIFATSPNAIRAATNATATLRIVGIDLESDPVVSGWAKEPRPPWRNFTSTFLDLPEMGGKPDPVAQGSRAGPNPGGGVVGFDERRSLVPRDRGRRPRRGSDGALAVRPASGRSGVRCEPAGSRAVAGTRPAVVAADPGANVPKSPVSR